MAGAGFIITKVVFVVMNGGLLLFIPWREGAGGGLTGTTPFSPIPPKHDDQSCAHINYP